MIEEERRRLEREKDELRAESKAAMNEQITRTMRMFQEQLAQTVKMAAMLQVWEVWRCGSVGGVGGRQTKSRNQAQHVVCITRP